MKIQLSSELMLPADAVTQKQAFLGMSGSGKTCGAGVFVEGLLVMGAPVEGRWPGLRAACGGVMGDKSKIEWTDIHVERFWANVEKTQACWNWTGGTFGGRYGQFRVGAKKIKAHRFSWMLFGHKIPDGLILCHRCDNVRCVNPAHIFLGTHADNAHDRDAKGRTARGHAPRLPGETNPSAILKLSDVEIIRGLIQGGMRRVDIATQYGVSKSTIHAIAQGRTWQTPRHP